MADFELNIINAISTADIAVIMLTSHAICSQPIRYFIVSLLYNKYNYLMKSVNSNFQLRFNFSAVVMCVATIIIVYMVTRILEEVGEEDSSDPAKVKFEISFCLVVAAGGSSVLATALSLVMHCYLHRMRERTQSDEELSLELMYSMVPADSISDVPPPAYSP